jgi:hypothetical protein
MLPILSSPSPDRRLHIEPTDASCSGDRAASHIASAAKLPFILYSYTCIYHTSARRHRSEVEKESRRISITLLSHASLNSGCCHGNSPTRDCDSHSPDKTSILTQEDRHRRGTLKGTCVTKIMPRQMRTARNHDPLVPCNKSVLKYT